MTVQARPGLSRDDLPPRKDLVAQHVRMPPFFPEILRKRIAGPELAQPRVLLQARLRNDRPRIGVCGYVRNALTTSVARALHVDRSQILIVLDREVLSPGRRIGRGVGQLDDPVEGIECLALALHDIGEQGQEPDCRERDDGDEEGPTVAPPPGTPRAGLFLI